MSAGCGLILVLLLLATPAVADTAGYAAALTSSGPVRAEGTVHAGGSNAHLELFARPAAAAHEAWSTYRVDDLRVEVVRVRVRTVSTPVGDVVYEPEVEREAHAFRDAQLMLRDVTSDFRFLAHSDEAADAHFSWTHENASVHPLKWRPDPHRFVYGAQTQHDYYYNVTGAPDVVTFAQAMSPRENVQARVQGNFTTFLAGTTLQVEGQEATRTFRFNDVTHTHTAPGTGTPITRVHTYTYGLLHATAAHLVVDAPEDWAARMHVSSPGFQITGALTVEGATGHVQTPDGRHAVHDERVRLEGTFHLDSALLTREPWDPDKLLRPDATRDHRMEGRFDRVVVDARPVFETSDVLRTVVAGTAALSLLTLLGKGLRAVGGSLLASLYTRIRPADVLTCEARRTLLAIVHREPGIHVRRLQRRTGFGWGKVHYHLGILRDMQYVRVERVGRRDCVFPPEEVAQTQRALARVRGTAETIYHQVPGDGGITQAEIEARSGLSRQLISYHLRKLAELGLVRALDTWPKRYVRAEVDALKRYVTERVDVPAAGAPAGERA